MEHNSYRMRLLDKNIFWKQNEAIKEASKNENLIIFATEVCSSGKRYYSVMTAEDMWNILKKTPSALRNMHEVIREGVPCKLYFDIEFKTEFNPDSDGDKMIKTFIELVCWGLEKKYNIHCSISDVLWLTSSTKEKYSAHLIFQLENYAFKNNSEAGNFFFYLLHLIKNAEESNEVNSTRPSAEELKHLIIKNDKGNEEVFCDTAVYAKNKNFRMFLATKYGKNVPLVLSKHNRYHVNVKDWMLQLFMDSLNTHFRRRNNLNLLECEDTYKPKPKGRSRKSCKKT